MTGPLVVLVVLAWLGQPAASFLATPLNMSDPDVASIFCPDQMTNLTRDHKWLTREGLRHNLREFFLATEPDVDTIPPSASLTQLYHLVYGEASSPSRFIKAISSITNANVQADSATQYRHDPKLQADGENLAELQETLAARHSLLLSAILLEESYEAARSYLGTSLHSIQKFYSHSTWVEQGNLDILYDLGLPTFKFEELADNTTTVCTPCSDPEGCTGNVVQGAALSSGYHTYDDPTAMDYLLPKPSSGIKCSHGGSLDTSADQPAQGGINKDTSSPCFSPHYHLHNAAAALAVKATKHYLTKILEAVGPEKYRRLFDLYHGSALSIVIDVTGSMSDDISAVKHQVHEIVASSSPELYILVPFSDPEVGPGLRTDDAELFLQEVDKLTAGGGGDFPEMFWSGLQMALSLTPNYGDIFTFTDATGKDGELMEGVIALSVQRHNKVSIIFSGYRKDSRTAAGEFKTLYEDQVVEQEKQQEPSTPKQSRVSGLSRKESTVEDYERLAEATGGLFISSAKFDIDEITPILGEGVESSVADLVQLKEVSGQHEVTVYVEESMFAFEVRLTGDPTTAVLSSPEGQMYNLMDQTALDADPDVTVVAYSSGLRAVQWQATVLGSWSLVTNSSFAQYSVSITANSTLTWLGAFCMLDPSPPHPHYRTIQGSPLINTNYYIMVTLIGYLDNPVKAVDTLEFVDKAGEVLRQLPYTGDLEDEFYVYSDPLPDTPFYIQLCGTMNDGLKFCRLLSVLMAPVETSVDVLATTEDLAAPPGDSANGNFVIVNYGLDSYFTVSGADDKGFLKSMEPARVFLATNETKQVAALFMVPAEAQPGTASTVTVTASSETQPQSLNSAISSFVVLSSDLDITPPSCQMNSSTAPDCSGYTLSGLCLQQNWSAIATVKDDISGLSRVEVNPVAVDGVSSYIEDFSVGTTGPVEVSYWASCCTTQVSLVAVDVLGNVQQCRVDMGVLGGVFKQLEAVQVGQTWILLQWQVTASNYYTVDKYKLNMDGDDFMTSRCKDPVCQQNITYLDPCSIHSFMVTPYYIVGSESIPVPPASTTASTLDQVPGDPINGQVTETTPGAATLSWTVTPSYCNHHFQVCYWSDEVPDSLACGETNNTTYQLLGLEGCVTYQAMVTTLSPSGLACRNPLNLYTNASQQAPGAPQNLLTLSGSPYTVDLSWDNPLERQYCVFGYNIRYWPMGLLRLLVGAGGELVQLRTAERVGPDYAATIYNLDPCTNYTFDVSFFSTADFSGPSVRDVQLTLETEPSAVEYLYLDEATTTSLHASWSSAGVCVGSFLLCYYNDLVVGETCEVVNNKEATLEGLLSCTPYHVSVTPVTPLGHQGNTTRQTKDTHDVAPGEVQNMAVVTAQPHSLTISYDPPARDPQCVDQYMYRITDLDDDDVVRAGSVPLTGTSTSHQFLNLQACSSYRMQVQTLSPEGLSGHWVTVTGDTSEEVTSEPQELQLTENTSTSLTLTWWRPEDNARCLTSYLLTWTGGAGVEAGNETVTATTGGSLPSQMEHTLTGLQTCVEYSVMVRAAIADGELSDPASVTASTSC